MGHVDEELDQNDGPYLDKAEPVAAKEQQGHQDDEREAAYTKEIDHRGENGGGAGWCDLRRWGIHGLKERPVQGLGNRVLDSGARGSAQPMLY